MTLYAPTLTPALSLRGRGGWLALLSIVAILCAAVPPSNARADDALIEALKKLDATVLPASTPQEKQATQRMLADHASAQLKAANIASTHEWRQIKTREQWDAFRKTKLELLRKSVAQFPPVPEKIEIHTSKILDGEGFKIHNIAFATRPHFFVTANLYVPHPAPGETAGPASAPGIIIQPSHHNPKTQSELQDMGMTFARAGCYVLVADQVGHGERRAHPFAKESDYAGNFRVGRQDYWFRYNTGMQLHLIGDSLIGWQAWDLMRGVDVLLAQKSIDPKRIIIMGSVAGGGDPAAVTAALDERIACSVIFNFGGPQPESKYPLPEDAEETFGYAGGGSFESTRNISFSCRDGTLPWVIVGSIAPRKHIHAHEFSWDRQRDPVWKRFETIYGWYGAPENLNFAHGFGTLREEAPKASHCNNIGPPHRKHIYAALEKWYGIPTPKEEYTKRRASEELLVMTPELSAKLGAKVKPLALHEAANAEQQLREGRALKILDEVSSANKKLRADWLALLAVPEPLPVGVKGAGEQNAKLGAGQAIQLSLTSEAGITVPVLLITPPIKASLKPPPVVVMLAQHGKQALLKERAGAIAALLAADLAVCLPDLRGCGETRLDSDRGRQSWDTGVSSTQLMLGQPMLGRRLVDLRAVVSHLRTRKDVDGRHVALWGDSLAPVNAPDRDLRVPYGADKFPALCEPMGATLAMLAALDDPSIKAVYARGGIAAFASALESHFVYVPHDMIVPGAASGGDLPAVAAALSPRLLWLEAFVDARNQTMDDGALMLAFHWARSVYDKARAPLAARPIVSDASKVAARLEASLR